MAGYGGSQGNSGLPLEQDFDVGPESVVIHPEYRTTIATGGGKTILADIALITLPQPVELNAGVQLVCLPHIETEFR